MLNFCTLLRLIALVSLFITSNSYAKLEFKTHDEKLREVALSNKHFAGVHINETGDTVLSIVEKTDSKKLDYDPVNFKEERSSVITKLYSYEMVTNLFGHNMMENLVSIYGGERFLKQIGSQKREVTEVALQYNEHKKFIKPASKIVIRKVTFSFATLFDWYQMIKIHLFALNGVTGADINERNNSLTIYISPNSDISAIKSLFKNYDIPKVAYRLKIATPVQQHISLKDEYLPLQGGFRLTMANNGKMTGTCTLGFIANINKVLGLVTAAHCTEFMGLVDGTVFYQGEQEIGVSQLESKKLSGGCVSSRECYKTDAVFVPLPKINNSMISSSYAIAKTKILNGDNLEIRTIGRSKRWWNLYTTNESVMQGAKVYKTGQKTGTTSGVISAVCVDRNVAGWKHYICQNEVDGGGHFSIPGDSGAAVLGGEFTNYRFGRSAELVGLHVLSNETFSYFTPIGAIIAEFGKMKI